MVNFILNKIKVDKINKTLLRYLLGLCGIKITSTTYKYDNFSKEATLHGTLLLPGKGCYWARQKSGGCFMCGFKSALSSLGINRSFSDIEILHLFDLGMFLLKNKNPLVLNIYNGGSFLNRDEISCSLQKVIFQRVKDNKDIRTLFIESRPEFITSEFLDNLFSNFAPKILKIGIGLESVTDKVRNEYINKGMKKELYEEAVRTARQRGVKILTYVLIKPIFLSEKEAIDEAVKTTEYAFNVGSDEVSFEASCIQKGTKMEQLYRQGQYQPPWLWSIIDVIKGAHNLGNIQIGSFWDFPLPVAKPSNCLKCSAAIEDLINEYRINHNLDVFERADCSCKEEWRKAIL